MKLGPLHEALQKHKVGFTQAVILCMLARGNAGMTEISKRVTFTTAACTGAVDALEKREFVERVRPGGDRRNVAVKITEAGMAIAKEIEGLKL